MTTPFPPPGQPGQPGQSGQPGQPGQPGPQPPVDPTQHGGAPGHPGAPAHGPQQPVDPTTVALSPQPGSPPDHTPAPMPLPSEQPHGQAGYGAHAGHAAQAGHAGQGPSSVGDGGATGRRRSPARIAGRALLVLAIVAALAGTTAWGFVNRASAEKWRDRSMAADEDLATSLDRIDATEDQLEDARQRLRDLASEKAGETDRNRVLADVVAQAPEVTEALADCQQQTTDLANDIIAAFNDPDADVAALQARTDDVNEVCADALDAAEELEETIDGLGI